MTKARAIMYGAIRARVWIDYQPPLMLSDAVSIADFSSVSPVFNLNLAEVLPVGDASLAGSQPNISDAVAVSDHATISYGYAQSVVDSVLLDDTATPVLVFGVAPTDLVTVSEVQVFSTSKPFSDPATMSDALNFDLTKSATDTVTVAESISNNYAKSINDSVAMSENATSSSVIPGTASTYVGRQTVGPSGGGGTITLPTGAAAGDICFVWFWSDLLAASITGGAGGWTHSTVGGGNPSGHVFYKILAAGDISGTLTLSAGSGFTFADVACYRGGSTIVAKSSAAPGAASTTTTAAGFTKSSSGGTVVTLLNSVDSGGSATPTQPAGFTRRSIDNDPSTSGTTLSLADVGASGYTNGASMTWSNLDNLGGHSQFVFELY